MAIKEVNQQTNFLTVGQHASAPSAPVAGRTALYAKTDGTLYSKDSAGVETPLGNSFNIFRSREMFFEFTEFPTVSATGTGTGSGPNTVTSTDEWYLKADSETATNLSVSINAVSVVNPAQQGVLALSAQSIGTAIAYWRSNLNINDWATDTNGGGFIEVVFLLFAGESQLFASTATARFFIGCTSFAAIDLAADPSAALPAEAAGAVIDIDSTNFRIRPLLRTGSADTFGTAANLDSGAYMFRMTMTWNGDLGRWESVDLDYSIDFGSTWVDVGTDATGTANAVGAFGCYINKENSDVNGRLDVSLDYIRLRTLANSTTERVDNGTLSTPS